mmetsp:Transcript_8324/g.15440  ORF Transcript_8324/g.15440 Transcript_8324/m.15440 type:complete len:148 (+) Transcript_8324:343-786(+)
MITPNGRFNINTKLCLSMSDFHPESWNPLWSVSSILKGLLSFMLEETPTYGSVKTTEKQKRTFAKTSLAYNCRSKVFKSLFPHYIEIYKKILAENPPNGTDAGGDEHLDGPDEATSELDGMATSSMEYVAIAIVVVFVASLMSLLYT